MKFSMFWRKSVSKSKRFLLREKQTVNSIKVAPFNPSLSRNIEELEELLGGNIDFSTYQFTCFDRSISLFFMRTLIDSERLTRHIISPIQKTGLFLTSQGLSLSRNREREGDELITLIQESCLPSSDTQRVENWQSAIEQILYGKALLLIDGETVGLSVGVKKENARNIDQPETEVSVIGPKESFVETLNTNIGLVRQRLRDPYLRVSSVVVGKRTKQEVAVLYLMDVANPLIVNEVRRRLSCIETDGLISQVQLQEFLEDDSFSLFPQIRPTERPDVTCSYLLEGNVVVLAEGSAHALLLPITFFQLLDTVDDYYTNWQYATLIRFVRLIALFFSIISPGLYLSLVAYNPELIPTRLLISMDAARVKVPFPILIEIFIMEVMIEILREAGVKLPKPVGQAVSIVGGLVIGEAAVNANLVSPVTVVIVALTAISSFAAPVYYLGITYRILRFFLLICSSIFGTYGLILGLFLIHGHVARLVSFGVPYLAPFSPLRLQDWTDMLIRIPMKKLRTRPTFLKTIKKRKASFFSMVHRDRNNK
ncbi:spore germination protein [Brevibacillus thermoruber]|uniref:spore germination protein n=2 Tax=Brevibacillus thermoruber TaxID=33942 RepID=UPI000AFCAB73|nr:spore germination protein [Brevibacillus thermoruber]